MSGIGAATTEKRTPPPRPLLEGPPARAEIEETGGRIFRYVVLRHPAGIGHYEPGAGVSNHFSLERAQRAAQRHVERENARSTRQSWLVQ